MKCRVIWNGQTITADYLYLFKKKECMLLSSSSHVFIPEKKVKYDAIYKFTKGICALNFSKYCHIAKHPCFNFATTAARESLLCMWWFFFVSYSTDIKRECDVWTMTSLTLPSCQSRVLPSMIIIRSCKRFL